MMTLMDLVGSTILGAAVIAAILGLTYYLSDSSQKFQADLLVQHTMSDFTKTIQWDMDKVGFRDTTGQPIRVAKEDTLTFLSDIDDSGTIRRVTYYRGSKSARGSTPNPNDFLLFRVVSPADTIRLNVGLTNFQFTYYDSVGTVTTNPQRVRGIQISAQMESASMQNDKLYSGVSWQNTYYPRNLNVGK